ncbi:MAG: NYN domain-containing protein [Gemmatimonadota bacterium]
MVDGYNVLHAIRRFAPRGGDPAPKRAAFECWLADAAVRHGVTACVLVWDGSTAPTEGPPNLPLDVIYSGRSKTADVRLLELCRDDYADHAARSWVVSSDHGVQRPARELGFVVLGAMTFYRRWSTA